MLILYNTIAKIGVSDKMLSRSAIVKLKAFLVIDIIIVGAAAGVYFYLADQGIITTASREAEFTLTNLFIDPPEAYPGEAVQISVNLTNIGDLEGNKTIEFLINNIVRDSRNVTLSGNSTEIITYTHLELIEGNYTVNIEDLSGYFIIKTPPPDSSKILLSNFLATPYEIWPEESTIVSVIAENRGSERDRLTIRVMVDDIMVNSTIIELDAGVSQTVQFSVNATAEGKHTVKINTLSGAFIVVKSGYHTLTINRSGGGSKALPFTLNGEELQTPYTALLPVGEYSISVPTPFNVGTGVLEFTYWSDGVRSSSRSFTLDKRLILVVTYTLISGYASCPSLYVWNGEGYSYITEISNAGWLGYIGYITPNGTIVFEGGNPWDYVKLDKSILATRDGYFDMALFQQWDELFYVDAAYMLAVDHPSGTDVYTTMSNYLNKGLNDYIYTVDKTNLKAPISAINEKGENVISQILEIDQIFTPGSNGLVSPAWNNITLNQLTLNLGDLSTAERIKLVINGMVDWGSPEPYYTWIEGFKIAASQGLILNNTEVYPAPYMEVLDLSGNWNKVAQDRQMPMPADYNARSFAVDLTGLFPSGVKDYQIRITNFFNVTFDYIAIDVSTQQNVTVQKIMPTANLTQIWDTQSPSTGRFTKYGDVTQLMTAADDMYVIGRQGDQIDLQFPAANLAPLAEGMERDYFFIVACWFKDPPGGWGYGFDFDVDPLPFIDMSGYPYPVTESYPYDQKHLTYIQQYNTRVIVTP
jgi:hypothetical protein